MAFPPKTINGWAALVVGLGLAVLPVYIGITAKSGGNVPLWALLVEAGLGFLALAIKGGGVELGKPGGGSVVGMILGITVAVMAMSGAGCPSAYSGALKAGASVKAATVTTSTALAAGSTAELQAGKPAGPVCKRLTTYRDNIRPAARSSVAALLAGVRIAREAGKKDFNFVAVLYPGGCALIMGLREWGHKLPDKGASILPLLSWFQGVACSPQRKPDASPALVALAAVLPHVVDFVRWIVVIAGAPDDKIEKEIADWLLAPAADEVDAVIKKHCPAGG